MGFNSAFKGLRLLIQPICRCK